MNVTAIMVTQPGREALAEEAIADFHNQSYSHKDLLILSTPKGNPNHIEWLTNRPATIKVVDGDYSLGALRNMGTGWATGPYCCQWDDDDRYHPDRITRQMEPLLSDPMLEACCLETQLLDAQGVQTMLDWRMPIPGTIIYRKDVAAHYPDARKGEDTTFLAALKRVISIGGRHPTLYVRRYHGSNTWDKQHFNELIQAFGQGFLLNPIK